MFTKTTALGGALLLLTATGGAALADATLTYESEKSGKNLVMIHAGKIRMVTPNPQGGGSSLSIYDSGQDRFIVIDETRRTYMVMDKERIAEQAQRMREMQKQMMAQMRERMKNIPEQQRKMLEQQMAQFEQGRKEPGPKVEIRRTGKTDVVNGLRCEVYQSYVDGRPMSEACIADPKSLGLAPEDYQAVKDMFAFIGRMAQSFSATAGGGTPQGFEGIDGLPVRTRDPGGDVMELRKVDTGPLDPKLFRIPEGYKETPMGGPPGP